MTFTRRGTLAIILVALASTRATVAEGGQRGRDQARPFSAVLTARTPLREGIGQSHESLTTTSQAAGAYYNQGLAYLHSYVWIEAARSFHQALRLDPSLAMAYLGLSYALSELGFLDQARSASQRADHLSEGVSERERMRIAIRASQLRASTDRTDGALQSDFRQQLDKALARFPNDVELLLAVGLAQDSSADGHGMGSGSHSLPFYERALAVEPDYFATHHYLTHAYENINQIDLALVHAERFSRAADAIPHAHHMYGHVLRRVDRMKDAIREFVRADELERAYLRTERIPPEYDWHYRHNLDLLGTSYEYVGQMKSAEAVLRHSFELTDRSSLSLNKKGWVLFLLARGRAQEALQASTTMASAREPLLQALAHILRCRSLLALTQLEPAAREGNVALSLMQSIQPLGGVLVPEYQLAQGEFLLRSGSQERGRALLRDAVAKLRAQSGPDAWVQTLFSLEALAKVARDMNDWALAAELAEEMAQHDASYAGTQYVLGLLHEHKGNLAAARSAFREAVQRWGQADRDFPEVNDARQRLVRFSAHAK